MDMVDTASEGWGAGLTDRDNIGRLGGWQVGRIT